MEMRGEEMRRECTRGRKARQGELSVARLHTRSGKRRHSGLPCHASRGTLITNLN